MINLDEVKEKDYLRINADDEWKGYVGIVDEKIKDILYIFCVQKPTYRYVVGPWNKNTVEKFENIR